VPLLQERGQAIREARICIVCAVAAIVRELDALMLVVEQWPRRRDACLAQAAAAAAVTPHTASSRGRAASGAAVDAVSSHAAATLAWLADHNNMEARIVAQLVSLRDRVTASTGAGIFSGGLRQTRTTGSLCLLWDPVRSFCCS
jgi:hypothetical protein